MTSPAVTSDVPAGEAPAPAPPRSRRRSGRRIVWLIVALAALGSLFFFAWQRGPATVRVVHPVRQHVVEALAVSGRVHGVREAAIVAPRAGVLDAVYVRDGDRVRAGQPLARVLSSVEREQMRQAEAAVAVAQAQLALAERGPLPSDVARVRAEVDQAVATARARLAQAREQLRLLEAGNRPEAIAAARAAYEEARAREEAAQLELQRQEQLFATEGADRGELDRARAAAATARAQLAQAQAARDQAARDLERAERLYRRGALPLAEVERARTTLATATAQRDQARAEAERADAELDRQQRIYAIERGRSLAAARAQAEAARQAARAARARLAELERGPREQEIERARAAVHEAEATLRGAERSGAAQLRSLLAQPRPEDVAVARARLEEARRAAAIVEERLVEGTVRAPFAGIVVGPVAEAGEAVDPARPLLRLVDGSRIEIRTDVDENHLARLHVGLAAVIRADAFPDRPFRARLVAISSQVDPVRGTVELRLRPDPRGAEPLPDLRPRQTVSVNLILTESAQQLTLPTSAVVRQDDRAYVFVVVGGRAVRRPVVVGVGSERGVPVFGGVSERDMVIANAAPIRDGQPVVVER